MFVQSPVSLFLLMQVAVGGQTVAHATAPVQALQIVCPNDLSLQSTPLHGVPDGRTSYARGKLMLNGADVTSGPPTENATLLPEIVGVGKAAVRKWRHLQEQKDHGIWVACRYGRSENFILSKQVEGEVSECTGQDHTDTLGQHTITITCKQ
jgi:hypothetical protein